MNGMLTVLAGLPGTGKTTVADALAGDGWRRVSRDEIMPGLFGAGTKFGDPAQKEATFREMLRRAEALLGEGRAVLLEGMPFSRRVEIEAARDLAARLGVPFRCLLCVCPDDVALARIRAQRGTHAATDRDDTLYRRSKASFEPVAVAHLAVDTTRPVEETVAACREYVASR